ARNRPRHRRRERIRTLGRFARRHRHGGSAGEYRSTESPSVHVAHHCVSVPTLGRFRPRLGAGPASPATTSWREPYSTIRGTSVKQTAVFGVAIALVLLRSFVATRYEAFFFDADQAIVGLMARHLSRFHHVPVFYYSLNYLLAVQAWIVAPFFWVTRSSVAVMRLPFVVLNAGIAVALIAMLSRELRLEPRLALVAALPFIVPTPATANQMLELAGANVEPIAYVLGLWALRRRPLAFGVLLAIGYLHRE